MNDLIISWIRTLVPVAVGAVVAWLAARGIDTDQAALEAGLVPIVTGAYYGLVRLAEQRWPAAGWLLGTPRPPHYGDDR